MLNMELNIIILLYNKYVGNFTLSFMLENGPYFEKYS
jgi:hypothetical protein